jgi:hypothetical protein
MSNDLGQRVQELEDREAIKELKGRYFRLVDEKDWDAWRGLFTDDATFDFGDGTVIEGADAFVDAVRGMVDGTNVARTVHHGHMPELSFDGPTEARGSWVLADYLEWEPDPETGGRRGVRGYGHEVETYRKLDGEWKIATWVLSYIRMDPLPSEPLPQEMFVGP